jgi:4-oxalocrotonate tautomerase
MRLGKTPAYRQAIIDSVYRAMRETFNVPNDDHYGA